MLTILTHPGAQGLSVMMASAVLPRRGSLLLGTAWQGRPLCLRGAERTTVVGGAFADSQ